MAGPRGTFAAVKSFLRPTGLFLCAFLTTACSTADDGGDETATSTESSTSTAETSTSTAETSTGTAETSTGTETGLDCVEVQTNYVEIDAEGNCVLTPTPETVCVTTEGLDGCAPGTSECPGGGDLVWVKEVEPGKWEMLVLPYSCAQPHMGFEGCEDYAQLPCGCGCA
jgi:hypothetical protein